MAVRIVELEDGSLVFENPTNGQWEPLVDGQSTYEGSDGIPRVYEAASNKFRKVEGYGDLLMKGVGDANTIIPSLGNMLGLTSDEALARAEQESQALDSQRGVMRPSDRIAMQEIQAAEEQGFLPTVGAVLSNPGAIGRQLVRALPTMGLGAVGAFAAGPGAVAAGLGGMASGTAVEAGSSYLNNLEQVAAQSGENLADPNALARTKSKIVDPNTGMTGGQMATQAASQRAIAMAPFTGLAAFQAARTGANLGMRSIASGIGQQAALGATGETVGQLAEKGQIYSKADIVVEGLAEGVFGVPEFAGHYIKNRMSQGVSQEEAANEAADIEARAEQELQSKPEVYLEAAKKFNAQRGTKIDTKKVAKGLARKAVAEGTGGFKSKLPINMERISLTNPATLDEATLQDIEQTKNTLQEAGASEDTIRQVILSKFNKSTNLPAVIPGETPRGPVTAQGQGLTKEDIARIKEEQRAEQGRKQRLAAIEARRAEEANRAPTELYRPRAITDQSNERLAQNVAAGNVATQAMKTQLQRNDKIGKLAKALAIEKAGGDEKLAQIYIPEFIAKLEDNPDFIVATAKAVRNEKGKFTGKKKADTAPGALLTLKELADQQSLEQRIANNPSGIRSQEEATAALPPQMQQATTDIVNRAIEEQQITPTSGADGDQFFDQQALISAKNQNEYSREKLVYLSPDEYLKLAQTLSRGPDASKQKRVSEVLSKGEKFRDVPFLSFDILPDNTAQVVGHEGRHRALELKRLGVSKMPVRLISREGGGGGSIRWGQFTGKYPETIVSESKDYTGFFPETITNPVTDNTRVKPKGNKRKYSKFQGSNVVDITKKLADKRDSFEAQQQAKARMEQRTKLQREGDAIVRKLLASLNLTGKVDPIVVLDKLADNAGGYVEGKTLVISALQPEGREFMDTFNHEVVHILKNLGLFTPQEWQALSRAAEQNGWVDTYLGDNPAYADLNPEERIEEAIAEHFAQTAKIKDAVSTPTTGLVNKLGKRIADFFKALRMYVEDALGITTPEEVLEIFDAIQNGTIGLRNNDLVNPENNPIKFSKLLSKKINDTKKMLLSPEAEANLNKRNAALIPFLGEYFTDITTLGARVPAVRPYRNAVFNMRKTDHEVRQYVADRVTDIFTDMKPNEKEVMTDAAVAITLNGVVKWPAAGKGMIVTLDKDFPGVGAAGKKIALTAKQVEGLKSLFEMYKELGNRQINAVVKSALSHLPTSNKDVTVGDLLNRISANSPAAYIPSLTIFETLLQDKIISRDVFDQARAILRSVQEQSNVVNNKPYIPFIRTSPYFMDFTNANGDVVTIALPTNVMGNVVGSGALRKTLGTDLTRFVNERLAELREVDETYNTDGKYRKVDAARDWSVSEKELSAFERLALLSQMPTSKDMKNSDNSALVKRILDSVRGEMLKKGIDQNWTQRKNVPGFVHSGNRENYLIGSSVIYGDRAARGISTAEHAGEINNALASLAEKVKTGDVHPSVQNVVQDHYDYLTNPTLQEGDISNKLRMFTFHMFLGFNPASAFLNLFQTVHTTLPVLTAAFGSPGEVTLELTKAVPMAMRFINKTDVLNPNVFKDVKNVDAPDDVKSLVNSLINKGILKVIITEEMQAKATTGGIVGGQTAKQAKLQKFVENYGNVSASMFSRTEALNRLVAAIAAHNLAKRKTKTAKGQEHLRNWLKTTNYENVSVLDVAGIAEAVVDTSQFDTSSFNRAKIFRGGFALPTQFLAFPVRMVQLYLDLLMNSFGNRDANGNYNFGNPQSKTAFLTMLLGLWATSGVMGMVPLGGAGADAYDKITNAITGVDPDIQRKLREQLVDMTGSPMIAEMVLKGFTNQVMGADVSDRVGASLFSGVQTDFKVTDLLGPFGGLLDQFGQVKTRLDQGHEMLAASQVLPPMFRNILKTMYEDEYGIVTQQGNVTPSDFSGVDKIVQSLGFTPIKLRETRDVEFGKQRLTATSSVLRERFTDRMTTARVRMILASRKGQNSAEYAEEFRRLRQELLEHNKKAAAEEKIPVDKVMTTVQRRVKEQLMAITQNKTPERRIPVDKRGIIRDKLTSIYPGGYTQNE